MSDLTGTTVPGTAGQRTDAGATATNRPEEPDWTQQVTDLIVDTVDKVRDRTTGPVLDISRSSVHALVALILMVPVGILFVVGAIRLLDWAIPGDVWFVYAGLGTILSLVGVLLWSKRTSSPR